MHAAAAASWRLVPAYSTAYSMGKVGWESEAMLQRARCWRLCSDMLEGERARAYTADVGDESA